MVVVMLFVFVLLLSNGAYSKDCHETLKETEQQGLGGFRPKCNNDGTYQQLQCHENYCFCVNEESGERLVGSEVTGDIPKCPNLNSSISSSSELGRCFKQKARAKGLSLIGGFIPRCQDDGSFEEKQCHSSTGHCWCVDKEFGNEVVGTRKGPGEESVNCNKPVVAVRKTCTDQENAVGVGLLGAYRPVCDPNDKTLYREIQCQYGLYCFCANPKTGEEILGTKVFRGIPKACNTPCIRKRHEQLKLAVGGYLLGVPTTRCTKDGKYSEVQCFKGTCWRKGTHRDEGTNKDEKVTNME